MQQYYPVDRVTWSNPNYDKPFLGSLPSLSAVEGYQSSKKKKKKETDLPRVLSDFDARYLGALDDFDELEDIEPGSLTLNNKG